MNVLGQTSSPSSFRTVHGRTRHSGGWILEGGSWRVDPGGWILEGGTWRVDSGGWILEGGFWRVDPGGWILESRFWRVDSVGHLLIVIKPLPIINEICQSH